MGIKWENVKVFVSPLSNNIYLGKIDKTGVFATDRSEDKSREVIGSTIIHLDNDIKKGESKIVIEYATGTLTWERKDR